MKLENQSAIVTGGGHGIGRAIALAFAREGAHVLVCGRNQERLEQTAADIRKLERQGLAMPCDVAREDQVDAMVQATVCAFGQVNILVNNAGIVGPTAPITKVTLAEWNETMAINLTGAFLCAKAVLPGMVERGSGKIINISSVAGRIAYALRAPYAVSKWGLIGLTRTLAQEVGPHNIQVNAVLPGPTAGERMQRVISERAEQMHLSLEEVEQQYVSATALRRMVDPEQIAATVVFLASSESDSITGQSVEVTAGMGL
jgi:NAD(P)-dependent dehydrogenase (short-subunit alcohol dehydrogenase family)